MRVPVVNILTYFYIAAVVVMVISTNIKPFFANDFDISKINTTTHINLDETSQMVMMPNQIAIAVLSIFGNTLTLVAIPYVKTTYGSEFSILTLNSIILILHLSLCDLLYSVFGLSHLIHAYFYKTNIYSPGVCYLLGMLRNLIAYTDFNTIAVISCCVARQTLCRECSGNNNFQHDHHDRIFGGRRIYLVCLATWLVSAGILFPDIIGWTGTFGWTGSAYACDNITNYETCENIGPFTNHIINFCTVIIFYAYVIIKIMLMRARQPFKEKDDEAFKSISLTMLLLTVVYLAFLIPIATFETCSPASDLFNTTHQRAIIANWYWWIYALNFFVYLLTSRRIRAAYIRFCRDAFRKLTCSDKQEGSIKDDTTTTWHAMATLNIEHTL